MKGKFALLSAVAIGFAVVNSDAGDAAKEPVFETLNPHIADKGPIGNLLADRTSPIDKVETQLQTLRNNLESTESEIQGTVEALSEIINSGDSETALASVEDTMQTITGLYEFTRDGGPLDRAILEAKQWMDGNRNEAKADTELDETQRSEILDGWQEEADLLNRSAAELTGYRSALQAELQRLSKSRSYIKHIMVLDQAARVNAAIKGLIQSLAGTVEAIEKLRSVNSTPAS